MASAYLSLVNAALAKLGLRPIADPREASRSAQAAAEAFDRILRQVAGDHPWNVASHVASAARLSEPAHDGWTRCALPADALRVLGPIAPGDWRVSPGPQGLELHLAEPPADGAPIEVKLLRLPEVETGLLRPHLEELIATRLAAELAMPLTRRGEDRDRYLTEYRQLSARAKALDAHEGSNRDAVEDGSSWLAARRGPWSPGAWARGGHA